MPYTHSGDGTSLYYERHGSSGPAILFVHGSGGHHAAWWQQVAALREEFTVLTVDLRGYGRSDSSMPEFDGQDFPGDVVAVLDQEDITDAMLVGQSIGSVAALRAGLARPERVSSVVLGHSLGGISHPELKELAAADRAEAVKLPVIDRLLTKEFQTGRADLTFLFQQMGTFNVAKMADLRNLDTNGPSLDDIVASGVRVAFLARREGRRIERQDRHPRPRTPPRLPPGDRRSRPALHVLGDAAALQRRRRQAAPHSHRP